MCEVWSKSRGCREATRSLSLRIWLRCKILFEPCDVMTFDCGWVAMIRLRNNWSFSIVGECPQHPQLGVSWDLPFERSSHTESYWIHFAAKVESQQTATILASFGCCLAELRFLVRFLLHDWGVLFGVSFACLGPCSSGLFSNLRWPGHEQLFLQGTRWWLKM